MKKNTSTIPEDIEKGLLAWLDGLESKARVEGIDDLLHCLQFERRLMLLTPEESAHMMDRSLSPAARKKLDEATSDREREGYIEMYARAMYFRECAWADYLNGVTNEKPFSSEIQTNVA